MSVMEPNKRGAGGRPPVARKGDVDARLLEAATRLFLTLGYEGTSCDLVAQEAHAGKASIYTRYANKTALLAAVVQANLEKLFDASQAADAADAPLRERLCNAGEKVIANALQSDAVALLRLLVAEAPRLRDIAVDANGILQRIGVQHVALAIAAPAVQAGQADAGAARAPAEALLDMVLMPALLRALLGADPVALQKAAIGSLPTAVDTLMALDMMRPWRRDGAG